MNAKEYLEHLVKKREMKGTMREAIILISIISIVFIAIILFCIVLMLIFVDVSIVLVDKNISLYKLFLLNSIFGSILGVTMGFVVIEFLKSKGLECVKHVFKTYKEFKEEQWTLKLK